MGWVLIAIGALVGAVASGALTYGTMLAREAIVVEGAVTAEKNKGIAACNARVGEIERVHNAAVADAVDAARRAAEALSPTPEAPAEIMALCLQSPLCRENKRP